MAMIAIFGASHCGSEKVLQQLAATSKYKIIDSGAYKKTTLRGRIPEDLITALDNTYIEAIRKIDRDRLLNLSRVQALLSELLLEDDHIIHGLAALLAPQTVSHILRVGLVADFDYRVKTAAATSAMSEKEARSRLKKEDKILAEFAQATWGRDPWDKVNYDALIPLHTMPVEKASGLILEYSMNDSVKMTEESKAAAENYRLSTKVKLALAEKKHDVYVESSAGQVTLIIKKGVIRLENYKNQLAELALSVEGVKSVDFKISPTLKIPSVWPPVDFEVPKKVLLVDDEREFVQTLSERLQRRQIEASIAYDGEQALEFAGKEQPEVMVLDLKMPGIDGIEVLRRIKKSHPETEVIILTGHGSARERQLAAELGAFAYLEKPVDIDLLSETMKKAYAKVALARKSKS